MQNLFMSVFMGSHSGGAKFTCDALFSAFWVSRGALTIGENRIRRGEAALLRKGEAGVFSQPHGAQWVRFDLTEGEAPADALLSAPVSLPAQPQNAACLLRLDQVRFPPGAQAYRHVHPGDGIRFLVQGELRVIADMHEQRATPGHAWFEAANSPVRAEASAAETQTSFVRFMVLPSAYVGKPSIRILDAHEAQLPRKQVTHRFIDELAYLSPG